MDRHLLVAVSDQKSAFHGVRFVGNFFSDKTGIKSTFFYSCPKPPEVYSGENTLETEQLQKERERKLMETGKQVLETAVRESVQLGFPKENIYQKLQTRRFTTVADIVAEGDNGVYDAVVLGRRSMTMLEAAFEESVSKSLFKDTLSFPLWLCRSSVQGGMHVLFHADGSQTSFTMADHVGFMVSIENRHRVDILPTESLAKDSTARGKYVNILQNHGLGEERINWLTPARGDLAGFILEAVDRKAYAAVALGRSNPSESMLVRLFRGPVCSRLYKELQKAALWICH